MTTIFITGASGFIGGHIAEHLVEQGHEVRALARSAESASKVEALGAEAVSGALGRVDASALAGVDAIIHCAARAEDWGTREQFWSANVEGTRQLLAVAREAGVPRFVHIGTEAALFDGRDLVDVDESHPYPDRHSFLYSETKAEAERLVLAANGDDMHTVSLRPRLVWGPRDQTVLPELARMIERGDFAWIDGGRARTSTTHVANLVHAVELALERGEGGQAYFIADGEDSSMRRFLTDLVATRGLSPPSRSVPGYVARPAARLAERFWRWLRRPGKPPMTSFAVSMMSRQVTVVIDKAVRDLGYRPRITVAEGMAALRTAA